MLSIDMILTAFFVLMRSLITFEGERGAQLSGGQKVGKQYT